MEQETGLKSAAPNALASQALPPMAVHLPAELYTWLKYDDGEDEDDHH